MEINLKGRLVWIGEHAGEFLDAAPARGFGQGKSTAECGWFDEPASRTDTPPASSYKRSKK